MLSGKTKNLGILGWPVEHSLSPAMQNAALARAGLDYAYIALPTPPEHLKEAVEGLLDGEGTCAHKECIASLVVEVGKREDSDVVAVCLRAVLWWE